MNTTTLPDNSTIPEIPVFKLPQSSYLVMFALVVLFLVTYIFFLIQSFDYFRKNRAVSLIYPFISILYSIGSLAFFIVISEEDYFYKAMAGITAILLIDLLFLLLVSLLVFKTSRDVFTGCFTIAFSILFCFLVYAFLQNGLFLFISYTVCLIVEALKIAAFLKTEFNMEELFESQAYII